MNRFVVLFVAALGILVAGSGPSMAAAAGVTKTQQCIDQIYLRAPDPSTYCDSVISTLLRGQGLMNGRTLEGNARFNFILALWNANWAPQGNSPAWVWRELASDLIAKGKPQQALQVVSRIVNDPYAILSMRADKAFDPVTALDPAWFEPADAFKRTEDYYRALMAGEPDKLLPVERLAWVLEVTGQYAEANALLTDALGSARVGRWSDSASMLNWAVQRHAYILIDLGQVDDGLKEFEKAAQLPEDGRPNVSQVLNMAEAYARNGRPERALEIVKDGLVASAYGRMVINDDRAIAYFDLKDATALAATVTEAKSHAEDGLPVYENMALYVNDMDEAARILIRRLSDPEKYTDALQEVQAWKPASSDFDQEIARRRAAMVARPDVQAAIASRGRIYSYPTIQAP